MADASSSPRNRGAVQLTARDLQLLAFLAEHRLVLATQVETLLGITPAAAATRLRALGRAGFLRHRRVFDGQPWCCRITRKGLDAIGSRLPAPRPSLSGYRHDVGLAWLWLAASSGALGPLREVLSERELRSRDGAAGRPGRFPGGGQPFAPAEPFGVRLGGFGPRGQERLHYPDLMLVTPEARRVALELELTPKENARREKILAGYASDRRIDAVIYLVEDRPGGRAIGRSVEETARRLGIASLVHVRPWRSPASSPASPSRAPARHRVAVRAADRGIAR